MYNIYIHIFPNGKRYVGQTKRPLKNRWLSNGDGYKSQFVVRIFEDEVVKYSSLTEASQLNSIPIATLGRHINTFYKNYYWKYELKRPFC